MILESIVECATIDHQDTVLEIGPGQGALTSLLLGRARQVVAVEFDAELARKLPGQFPGKNLQVQVADILSFNLTTLPKNYKVVANVPYYITSKIIQLLSESANPPSQAVLLVQKEVAERLAAQPGAMSLLSVSSQVFFEVSLGPIIGAEWFTPPPKVDSRVVILDRRRQPFIGPEDQKQFFRLVKAGFVERRKKLRSSLAAGLAISKAEAVDMLAAARVSGDSRAQELSLADWKKLLERYKADR